MIRILCALGAALITLTLSTACTRGQGEGPVGVQPAKNISDSFAVAPKPPVTSGDLAVDKFLVGVRRSALEKEFLMRTEMIQQAVVPAFQGLRSRIIAFREHSGELLMLEATQGHVVDNTTPATLVLAKFKILREVDEVIYFDLNQGFSQLYLMGDWYGSSGPEGRTYNPDQNFRSVPMDLSFIEEARFDAANNLIVTQAGQLKTMTETGPANYPVKARFFFSTYNPDPSFKKLDMGSDFTQFGYFEANPMMHAHGTHVYASKFQHNKPIVFAVSANTPAEFKDAVKEGILYWNKAFGREILKAVDAPAGVLAPSADLSIVQWNNWDDAGFAYADAQMDPRTGQILNAQVFMTSAFAVGGKAAARKLIRQLNSRPSKPGVRLALRGFRPSVTCNRAVDRHFAGILTEVLAAPNVQDAHVLRAAQDYVRNVVAHEVGHTLGLRHNFAGSLAATYKVTDHPQILKDYFTNGTVNPNHLSSSTVMDYDGLVDALVAGHQLKALRSAYQYDEMAIRHLYDGIQYSRAEVPPFCTDESMGVLLDCGVWDTGASAIESASYFAEESLKKLPLSLMNIFVQAKAPGNGMASVPVERVAFDLDILKKEMLGGRSLILASMEKASRFMTVERQFEVVDSVNEEAVRAKKMDYVKQEIDRVGGLAKVLAPWTPSMLQTVLNSVDVMVDSGLYDKGVDQMNNPYQFSAVEMEVIRKRSKAIFTRLFEILPEAEQAELSAWVAELPEHGLSEEYAELLKDRVDELLLATTGATIQGEVPLADGTTMQVELPVFKYKHSVRKAAYAMLQREGKPSVDWGYVQREEVKGHLGLIIDTAFHNKWEEVKTEGMHRPILRWYLENKELYAGMDDVNAIIAAALRDRMK